MLFDWLSTKLLLWKLSKYHRQSSAEKSSKTRKTFGPIKDGKPVSIMVPTHTQLWNPDEHDHRRKERTYWCSSICLSVFTTGAAVAAAAFAFFALKASQAQVDVAQEAYLASNRAWLDVSIDVSKLAIEWETDGMLKIAMSFSIVNKGHSPALNAVGFPGLVTRHTFEIDKIPKVEAACKQSIFDKYVDRILFMDQTVTQDDMVVHSSPDDAAYFQDISRNPQNHVRPNGMPEIIRLIACVSYRIIGDNKIHYTSRVYDLGKSTLQSNGLPSWAPIAIGENVAKGQGVLREEFQGNNAE